MLLPVVGSILGLGVIAVGTFVSILLGALVAIV